MSIVVNIRNDETYSKIQSYNNYKPGQRRNAAVPESSTMNQHEDTISSNQAKDSSRCPYTDLLWRKVKTGGHTDHTRYQVDQQETSAGNVYVQKYVRRKCPAQPG